MSVTFGIDSSSTRSTCVNVHYNICGTLYSHQLSKPVMGRSWAELCMYFIVIPLQDLHFGRANIGEVNLQNWSVATLFVCEFICFARLTDLSCNWKTNRSSIDRLKVKPQTRNRHKQKTNCFKHIGKLQPIENLIQDSFPHLGRRTADVASKSQDCNSWIGDAGTEFDGLHEDVPHVQGSQR